MIFETDISQCVSILRNRGVILYPTDSVWGIGCDATDEDAVALVYKIKQRAQKKSMIILLPNEDAIKNYAKPPNREIRKMIKETESPLTIIYPDAKNLASNLINEDGTIAIRIPKDDFCKELLQKFGKPIISTSANVSGETPSSNFNEINAAIKKGVNYFCTYKQNEKNEIAKASKIVKWNADDSILVIRE